MSLFSRVKILFCVQLFFGLCNAIVINEDHLKCMSREEMKLIFETDDGSAPKCEVVECVRPSRSKRSGGESINIMINAFGNLTTTLYVVEDDDLISRNMTGVWAAQSYPRAYQNVSYYPDPHIWDIIGKFELLQNVEERSAIARFWDADGNETILGLLKQNYTVNSVSTQLEYGFIDSHQKSIIRERSVNSMEDQDEKPLLLKICKNPEVWQEYFHQHTSVAENDFRPDINLDRSRRQITNSTNIPDVVHPTLLLVADFSIVNRYANERDLMIHLIAQFNSVDMIFRQLKDPEVHLNIAGIIMSMDNTSTPYMSNHININNQIIGDSAVFDAEKHFQNTNRRFPHAEWDTILLLTSNPIVLFADKVGHVLQVEGLNSIPHGCSIPHGIVRFINDVTGIFSIAHTLGHMLGANHDAREIQCKNGGNYIMGNDYNSFTKLEWSSCSQAVLQTQFRSKADRCGIDSRLAAIPDKVKNMPGAWLTLHGQCDNFYNDSTDVCITERLPNCFTYECKRSSKNETCEPSFAPPMEGTVIYNESGLQACINGSLVPV